MAFRPQRKQLNFRVLIRPELSLRQDRSRAILNRVSPLEEWHEAFKEMHPGKIVKGVLKP